MIPVYQKFKRDPENGIYGDCHKSCIASILKLDWDVVPHFVGEYPTSTAWESAVRKWLRDRNMGLCRLKFFQGEDLDWVLKYLWACSPDTYYIPIGV